jgi:spermidine/putrescine-binding protein
MTSKGLKYLADFPHADSSIDYWIEIPENFKLIIIEVYPETKKLLGSIIIFNRPTNIIAFPLDYGIYLPMETNKEKEQELIKLLTEFIGE